MKTIKIVLPVFAFIFAIGVSIAANFISPPPTQAYGKHTSLGCILGNIQQTQSAEEFCDITHLGTVCTVRVGTVPAGFQIKDAYVDQQECIEESEVKLRLNNE